MFSFLFGKQKELRELIDRYLDYFIKTGDSFRQAMDECYLSPGCESFEFNLERTHKYESLADDIREEIKDLMYANALIPESRGDVMGLIEALDRIPNQLEAILYDLWTTGFVIPETFGREVKDLIAVSLDCCDLTVREVQALFARSDEIKALGLQVDQMESRCDHLQRKIIRAAFASDINSFDKLLLRDLVHGIGQISDEALRVSQRIYVVSIKRRV